ncbi:MAG: Ig-like domain-containing protein [Candidatus Riflebacteria bacterium]|nr:Ig-like domain-containing protein [Candidatus Riflebacteria bacterium]
MNRWKKAALICAFAAAAMCNCSPVDASINKGYVTETAAINIVNHFPGNMATGVAPDSPLTVEFAGPVSQAFYQTINFSLFNGTQPIDGELFYNPAARQVMFKAKSPLTAGDTYTARISYFDGLGKNADKIWNFRTADNNSAAINSSAIQIKSENAFEESLILTNASMGAGSIAAELPLEVTFSEPVDISTLKQAPIQLFEDNVPVAIDYKLSRDMKTITINPRASLKVNSSYAVAVDKKLVSTKGSILRKKTLIPFRLSGSFNEPLVSQHEINETPAPAYVSNVQNPFVENQNVQTAQLPDPVQVIGLAPQNGAKVTNLTQPITIGFNEDIRPETLNEFTFRLEDDFGPIPSKIHYFENNKQATLTPIGLLDTGKSYKVVVTQGITDKHGRPIRSGITSMFSTSSPVSEPAMPSIPVMRSANYIQNTQMQQTQRQVPQYRNINNTPDLKNETAQLEAFENNSRKMNYNSNSYPAMAQADKTVRIAPEQRNELTQFKVTSVFPAANADNISRKSKIALHFSEPADPKSINNINISVFANQKRVDGKVIYDRKNNRAIFEPERQLDAKTEYKVIVSNKIQSKMGEPLTQRVAWEFTTNDNARALYTPTRTAEADSAFYIPLVDSKYKPAPSQLASIQSGQGSANSTFSYIPKKHWAFKSVKHITNKGILNAFPFTFTDNVTRYEFATAVNNALSNLKSMQTQQKTNLRVADMIHLQQLIVEFRSELRSYGVNTQWFESFLEQQGVNLQQVEAKVRKLDS